MIFSAFRGPGAHFGSLGTHFEDISDFHDFEDASGAKGAGTSEPLFRHFLAFFAKTKKCVWTAQACADCISSFPENALFRNFFHPFF